MNIKHLVFDSFLYTINNGNKTLNAILSELGVTYEFGYQGGMLGDGIYHMWNCKGVPKRLPKGVEVGEVDVKKLIGGNLTLEMAMKISPEEFKGGKL